jgi:hypothetical protein
MYEQEFYETVAIVDASIATSNFHNWTWFRFLLNEMRRLAWLSNIG